MLPPKIYGSICYCHLIVNVGKKQFYAEMELALRYIE